MPLRFSSLCENHNISFDLRLCSMVTRVDVAGCLRRPWMPVTRTRCSRVLRNSASRLPLKMISLPNYLQGKVCPFLNKATSTDCAKYGHLPLPRFPKYRFPSYFQTLSLQIHSFVFSNPCSGIDSVHLQCSVLSIVIQFQLLVQSNSNHEH